jgi:energy-converting hydrogenase Eha subunit C
MGDGQGAPHPRPSPRHQRVPSRLDAALGVLTSLPIAAAVVTAVAASREWLATARPATCLPDACFCEAVRPAGLAQPVNTVTSFAYVALGIAALLASRSQGDAAAARQLTRGVGTVLVLLGLGSAWYHGTLTFVGQVLDVQAMFLLGTLVLGAALVRTGRCTARQALLGGLALTAALLALQILAPQSRRVLFGLVLLPGLLLEARHRAGPLRVGLALLVLAYAAWVADATGAWCSPTAVTQGHGLWHLLTAAAAVMLVPHYAATTPRSAVARSTSGP